MTDATQSSQSGGSGKALIHCQGLQKSFHDISEGREIIAIQNLDFEVLEGEFLTILGPSGCGKSTLLNRLAGRDAAIVASEEGTTRDVIEVRMDIAGWPLTVADTAGLRVSTSDVEAEGMRRARTRAAVDPARSLIPELFIVTHSLLL